MGPGMFSPKFSQRFQWKKKGSYIIIWISEMKIDF